MTIRAPQRVWVGSVALAALALLLLFSIAASDPAAGDVELAQYASSTTTSSTSTTVDRVTDVAVPPGSINASGGGLGPSTILIASVLLGIVIVGSMISGSTFISQKESQAS